MRILWAAVGMALALAGAAVAEPARLEPVGCDTIVPMPPGVSAECGWLHVPENRADPQSRDIAVPFLRARSSAASPAPDPLVILTGGPGGSAINPNYIGDQPALAARDVIWFEQRGTALTRPALHCPEYVEAGRQGALGALNAGQLARARISAARTCANRARAEGVDLAGYTSAEVAADLEDLRRLLGFSQLNLYGTSYGGRIATTYARDYPQHTRSLVLNTPLPVEANYDEHGSAGMRRTLNMVFDGCAVDAACAAAFPNVRAQYAQIIAAAARRPQRIMIADGEAQVEVRVTDRVLASAVSSQLYAPFTFEVLPRTIDAIARGDLAVLASILGAGRDDQAWLMRIAVWCNDEYPFEDKAAVARQRTNYPEFAGVDESTVPIGACEAAGFSATAAARENEPVATQAPVLIFSGAYDPATQPAWHRAMAAHMPNARVATFPAGGHGSGFYYGCAWEMMVRFLDAPDAALDATCLLSLRDADFSRAARAD